MAADLQEDGGIMDAQGDLSLLIVADYGTLQALYKWKYSQLLVMSTGLSYFD